ncbi:RWD domain-containing protein 3-like [Lepeophtheirus salmonis]|uniref:RWD domain-containing protein 3-like n=1 Tax=Lepeophtheirus salmonis TaxID=72036 RepID=UPI001AE945F9|nr:RWD domain-containing protein 3-like [Lepeophtheirus salmonis]
MDSNTEVKAEIDLLTSIYSATNESVSLQYPNFLHIQLTSTIKITLEIPAEYPHTRAPILQSLQGTEISCNQLGINVIDKTFVAGTPCLYSIVESLRDLTMSLLENNDQILERNTKEHEIEEKSFMLLELDHMRNEKRYVKNLKIWTTELDLQVRLLQFNKGILLLLMGELNSVKDFVARLRNRNVDVDSRGKPCKEKMSKVLCSLNSESPFVFVSPIWNKEIPFQFINEKRLHIRDFLSQYNLNELYAKYII